MSSVTTLAPPLIASSSGCYEAVWQSAIVSSAKRPDWQHWLDAARHPARKDGAIALAWLLLPWLIALALASRHHLDAVVVAILAAVSIPGAALWLVWVQVRDARRSVTSSAEQLAPHEQREMKARDQLRQHLGRQDRLTRIDETSALALRVHPAFSLPRLPESTAALGAETDSRLSGRRRRFLPRPRRGQPSHVRAHDPDLPTFVTRDRGTNIASWMRRAREDGGFLVLVGDSSVGKTRLLYETARDVLPDFAVLAPDLGDGNLVNSIAGATFALPKLIVWLDELQRFLDGPYLTPGSTPITAKAVRHLLDAPTPVVVLGAMWPEHASQLRATEPDPRTGRAATSLSRRGRHPRRPPGPTGDADQLLGDRTRSRAQVVQEDPRLEEALADRDYNVTEVLAGAPQLVARYEQASEEQQAVLNAAIDARRLGIQAPLTGTLLRAAARGYLSTLHPDDTWLSPALTELTRHDRPQDHATAPLIPVLNEEKTEILGYTVADYLMQHISRERRSARVPAGTWHALIGHIRDPDDLARLALHAESRLLYRYAEPLYRRFAGTGDTIRRPSPGRPARQEEQPSRTDHGGIPGPHRGWPRIR